MLCLAGSENGYLEMTWLLCVIPAALALTLLGFYISNKMKWSEFYKALNMPISAWSIRAIYLVCTGLVALPSIIIARIYALQNVCGDQYDLLVILFLVDTLLNNMWVVCFVGGWMQFDCCCVLYKHMRARASLIFILLDLGVTLAIVVVLADAGEVVSVIFASVLAAWRFVIFFLNGIAANKEADNDRGGANLKM
jgi:hypothetical protein